MCGRISPKLQYIIKVAGKITGVKSNQRVDIFDKRAVGKARAVVEFALHLLYRELEFLLSGRRFRLLKGKSNGLRNSFLQGNQLVPLCLIYVLANS